MELNSEKSKKSKVTCPEDWKNGSVVEMQWEYWNEVRFEEESGGFGPGYNNVAGASLMPQRVKNLPAMRETWVQSLGQEDPLEKRMATHTSILAWPIPQKRLVFYSPAYSPPYSPWGRKELEKTERQAHTHTDVKDVSE